MMNLKNKYVLKNGIIIDPLKENMYKANIIISEGIIENIVERDKALDEYKDDGYEIIDISGMYVGPGLADTHVHFRDPGFTHKEDIITGAMAAKRGGYTQIVLMANTNPHVDNIDTLKYVIDKGLDTKINIHTCANVTMDMAGKDLVDMKTLLENGAVGFTDDGVPIMDEKLCYEAIKMSAIYDVPISFHEENPKFIENNGVNKGKASDYYNIGGSPKEAEIDMIKRDIDLAKKCKAETEYNPKIVIQHISSLEGVKLVKEAKLEGLNIHAEATPHHFTLTEDAVIKHGTNAKMNPPLRTLEDMIAIKEGLLDGTIDMIATDHAPHSKEEKSQDITKAPSGITGLETAFSLAVRELVNTNILSYPELFKRMSLTPCVLYKLNGGVIKKDSPADLVIFNPNENWEVKEDEFRSKSSNSPFIGEVLPAKIHYTICNGEIVYKE